MLPGGISLQKTGDRAVAEVGDTVRYTVTVQLTSGARPRQTTVVDRLPPGTDPTLAAVWRIHQERARRVREQDFEHCDLILAMDRDNLANLQDDCPAEHRHKLHLFLDYAGVEAGGEVPDPYYGNLAGFERVLALCEAAARGVLDRVLSASR